MNHLTAGAMPRLLAPGVCEAIWLLFEAGDTDRAIHRAKGVSRAAIARLRLSYELFSELYPPSTVKQGRKRILSYEQEQVNELDFGR